MVIDPLLAAWSLAGRRLSTPVGAKINILSLHGGPLRPDELGLVTREDESKAQVLQRHEPGWLPRICGLGHPWWGQWRPALESADWVRVPGGEAGGYLPAEKTLLQEPCYEIMLSWKVSGILDMTENGGSALSPFPVFVIFVCEILHRRLWLVIEGISLHETLDIL